MGDGGDGREYPEKDREIAMVWKCYLRLELVQSSCIKGIQGWGVDFTKDEISITPLRIRWEEVNLWLGTTLYFQVHCGLVFHFAVLYIPL